VVAREAKQAERLETDKAKVEVAIDKEITG